MSEFVSVSVCMEGAGSSAFIPLCCCQTLPPFLVGVAPGYHQGVCLCGMLSGLSVSCQWVVLGAVRRGSVSSEVEMSLVGLVPAFLWLQRCHPASLLKK